MIVYLVLMTHIEDIPAVATPCILFIMIKHIVVESIQWNLILNSSSIAYLNCNAII